ncbi:MAG: adenine deaminase [Chlamydia sp. 32-24]|nr:MAG: adenine deaminase [Chlamydia sp. 32-24]
MMSIFTVKGNVIDLFSQTIYSAEIEVGDQKILKINKIEKDPNLPYILPGFIDAHIHIESSMLIPSEFAKIAVQHGTVATVSDPHEIGNVLGLEGVIFMIENSKKVPFHFYFGVPSCVPCTSFETSGATIGLKEIEHLFESYDLKYLSEMMNYPAVLANESLVMDKISLAKKYNKPVDGHAPGLMGEEAIQYIKAGITTDHECFKLDEALHKLKNGMKIIIREGSAAKNFDALHPIITTHTKDVMLCSDDKHPDELIHGHINLLVKRAIKENHNLFKVLSCASLNPIEHYNLDVGLLRLGDSADFIMVNNLTDFSILMTVIKGKKVFEQGQVNFNSVKETALNHFNAQKKQVEEFEVPVQGEEILLIKVIDKQLLTEKEMVKPKIENNLVVTDLEQDILKIAVVNRYQNNKPSLGFVKNFGLKSGAIASCVAHDSHNIVAVGVDDESICQAVNAIIENKGGIAFANKEVVHTLALPIGGIMSNKDGYEVAKKYENLNEIVKNNQCTLTAPFMTLSFLALLVIPHIKLSDKGLFDVDQFRLISLFSH